MLILYSIKTGEILQTSKTVPTGGISKELFPDGVGYIVTESEDISGKTHKVNNKGKLTAKQKSEKDVEAEVEAWGKLRAKRASLLSESDKTQLVDSPFDTSAWQSYRQALRDLPENTTDPFNPIWPEKPK